MDIYPNLQQKDQNIPAIFAWILKVTQYRAKDVQAYNQLNGLFNKFISALGINTSSSAAASSISFTTATAAQVITTSDAMLYIACTTSAALTISMGPTSAASAVTILNNVTVAKCLMSVRVPAGWYVELTGTMADFSCSYVTC